jgi:L,D-transpeptidase ErfK/SrfK
MRRLLGRIFLLVLFAPLAQGATTVPKGDVIGRVTYYTVQDYDNLYEIARRENIGIVEILAANPGTDPWLPAPGTKLTIPGMYILPPGQRRGIVVNLSALRLFYYTPKGEVATFPIGIGKEGWGTPVGTTKIVRKRKDPVWTPPASIRAKDPELPKSVPPGEENPLGGHALDLAIPSVLIHGTNRPYGVGKRSSHGCIRLYPEDMATLFAQVKTGTQVTIIDAPYLLGWKDATLWLKITPNQKQADSIADYQTPAPLKMPELHAAIRKAVSKDVTIDWDLVAQALKKRNGIPVAIGRKT